jgi:hypothetical protein
MGYNQISVFLPQINSLSVMRPNLNVGLPPDIFIKVEVERLSSGSDSSVVVRQRQGFKTIGGQYGVVSIVRMPNQDFVLSGDLA